MHIGRMEARRQFLRFLAGSPLLTRAFGQDAEKLLSNPAEALNVMDFEPVAKKVLPPAHLGYLLTGTDGDETLAANRAGYSQFQLLARRLVDWTGANTRTRLFGREIQSPIYLAPVGALRAFHPEGEIAVARAARARRTEMMLSTNASAGVEEVSEALGRPALYQLYTGSRWDITEKIVKRAEAAGCPLMAWTVDTMAGRNTETMARYRRLDTRNCAACHPNGQPSSLRVRPMYKGIDLDNIGPPDPPHTWASVERLKKMTTMKVLVKGIVTPQDAALAVDHGADGVIVSNHGGRAEPSGRGTIEALKDVVDAVGARVPVLIDGGVRRGSDVYKALALGATAVGIGRPYVWGLAGFGQPGVDRVLELLNAELLLTMRQMGTPTIPQITRAAITRRG